MTDILLHCRADLRSRAIAVKMPSGNWTELTKLTLSNARNEYDAGYAELATYRSPLSGHSFLIFFPRKSRADRADNEKFAFIGEEQTLSRRTSKRVRM